MATHVQNKSKPHFQFLLFASMALIVLPACFGQTNSLSTQATEAAAPEPLVFAELYSTNGSILMTNAEFRSVFGHRVIFKNDFESRAFDIDVLSPAISARLKLEPSKPANATVAAHPNSGPRLLYQPEPGGWHGAQPVRPELQPLALDDREACLNELATLASFPLFLNFYEKRQGPGVPYWGEPSDEISVAEWIDLTVRIDRLQRCRLPEIHDRAVQLQGILVDLWRTWRAAREIGFAWRMRELDHTETGARMSRMWTAVTSSTRDVTDYEFGAYRIHHFGPTAEELDSMEDDLETAGSAQQARAQLEDYYRKLCGAEDAAFDELSVFWERNLLALLETRTNGASAGTLLIPSTRILPCSSGYECKGTILGSVALANASGGVLSNLVIHVEEQGYLGDHLRWFGFIPRLAPGDIFYTHNAGKRARVMTRAGTATSATVTAWTENIAQPSFNAAPVIVGHMRDYTSSGGNTSYDVIELGAWDARQTREMMDWHQTAVRESSEFAAGAGIRGDLSQAYVGPRNPVQTRTALLNNLKLGIDYEFSDPEDADMTSETATVSTNTAGGVYILAVTASWDPNNATPESLAKRWRTHVLVGRLIETDDYGTVLAFAPASGRQEMAEHEVWMITSLSDMRNWEMDQRVDGGWASSLRPSAYESDPAANAAYFQWQDNRYFHTTFAAYVIRFDHRNALSIQCAHVLGAPGGAIMTDRVTQSQLTREPPQRRRQRPPVSH
jgi:hypothetical protein